MPLPNRHVRATGSTIRPRTWGPMARAGAALACVVASWPVLARIIAADRGIDLTDEGLYLLAADPPSVEAVWIVPFGWHTAPLFRLVGYDVAHFRTLGAVLLIAASAGLALAAVRVAAAVRALDLAQMASAQAGDRLEPAFAAVLGACGGLLYYGGFVRTPSYNWVTVLGAVIGATGFLLVISAQVRESMESDPVPIMSGSVSERLTGRDRLENWSGIGIAAFGAFLTVPAKPTTPVFIVMLFGPLLLAVGGARFAVRTLGAITGGALALAATAMVSGVWSMQAIPIMLRALTVPSPEPRQSLAGALRALPALPLEMARDGRTSAVIMMLVAVAGRRFWVARKGHAGVTFERPWLPMAAALLLILVGRRLAFEAMTIVHASPLDGWTSFIMRNRSLLSVVDYLDAFDARIVLPVGGLMLGLIVIASRAQRDAAVVASVLLLVLSRPTLLGAFVAGDAVPRFARPEITLDLAIVLIVLVVLQSLQEQSPSPIGSRRTARLVGILAPSALFALGITTAFGSANSLVNQGALAAALMVAAAVLLASVDPQQRVRRMGLGLIAIVTLATVTLHGLDSRTVPYRMFAIVEQSERTIVGHRGGSLFVDEATARLLHDLTAAAEAQGWVAGTPLLPLASRWSATIPWHLGARVPDSLMLTLGGYDAAERMLGHNLGWALGNAFEDAWVVVSAREHPLHDESYRWAQEAARAVSRTFPADYVLVHTVQSRGASEWVEEFGLVELWRPRG